MIKARGPGYLGGLLRLQSEFRSSLGKLGYAISKTGSTGMWEDGLMGKSLALELGECKFRSPEHG